MEKQNYKEITTDLGKEIERKINRKIEREQEFKRTLIHILKDRALVGTDELVRLEGLI